MNVHTPRKMWARAAKMWARAATCMNVHTYVWTFIPNRPHRRLPMAAFRLFCVAHASFMCVTGVWSVLDAFGCSLLSGVSALCQRGLNPRTCAPGSKAYHLPVRPSPLLIVTVSTLCRTGASTLWRMNVHTYVWTFIRCMNIHTYVWTFILMYERSYGSVYCAIVARHLGEIYPVRLSGAGVFQLRSQNASYRFIRSQYAPNTLTVRSHYARNTLAIRS